MTIHNQSTGYARSFSKFALGGLAAGALALGTATPVMAHHKHRDKIGAGDVIAGALIIGGIAAIANSVKKKDRYRDGRYRDRRYRDRDYHYDSRHDRRGHYSRRNNPRRAVEKCVRAAERDARRYGYRYADVTEIRDVRDTRYGWQVKGRIVVDNGDGSRYRDRRGYRHDVDYRDRRHRGNGYGYGRNSDRGKFSCYVDRGRVTDVNFRNIRGLR